MCINLSKISGCIYYWSFMNIQSNFENVKYDSAAINKNEGCRKSFQHFLSFTISSIICVYTGSRTDVAITQTNTQIAKFQTYQT